MHVLDGDADRGIADFEKMLQLDAADPAAHYEATSRAPLEAEALQHGRQQLQRMLKDRPAMAQYGEKAAALRNWAARKFAGEDLKSEILGLDRAD